MCDLYITIQYTIPVAYLADLFSYDDPKEQSMAVSDPRDPYAITSNELLLQAKEWGI